MLGQHTKKSWVICQLKYATYVFKHKLYVFLEGRKLGVSCWQLFIHDWSKFTPMEWLAYAEFFYGAHKTQLGAPSSIDKAHFQRAWNQHIHRNPHHWQSHIYLNLSTGGRYNASGGDCQCHALDLSLKNPNSALAAVLSAHVPTFYTAEGFGIFAQSTTQSTTAPIIKSILKNGESGTVSGMRLIPRLIVRGCTALLRGIVNRFSNIMAGRPLHVHVVENTTTNSWYLTISRAAGNSIAAHTQKVWQDFLHIVGLSKMTSRQSSESYATTVIVPWDFMGIVPISKLGITVADNGKWKCLHCGRNLTELASEMNEAERILTLPMPSRYVREMVADWRGAGRAQGNPDTVAWYNKRKDGILLHPATCEEVEQLLGISEWISD